MKKIVSLLMVVLMAFTFMPWSVFAEDNEAVTEASEPAVEAEEESEVPDEAVVPEESENDQTLEGEELFDTSDIELDSNDEAIETDTIDIIEKEAASDSDDPVKEFTLKVKYGQTEARKMLSMINNFRTSGADAWAWNSTNTKKVPYYCADLTYDYALEKVAMRRAAELAISYSHTRPDGTSCYTAYPSIYDDAAKGENIAYGTGDSLSSAEEAFVLWREDDKNYIWQGHRRNMLDSEFRAVGIGHVVYEGKDFWVQEFSSKIVTCDKPDANDSQTSVRLRAVKSIAENYSTQLDEPSEDTEPDVITEQVDNTLYHSGDYSYTLNAQGEAALVIWWGDRLGDTGGDIEIPSAIDGHVVTELGSRLFFQTWISSVYIPSTIRHIESDVFSYCTSIRSFTVAPNNMFYTDDDGVLYSKNMTRLYFYPARRSASYYHVPEDVEYINCTAFAYANMDTLYLDDPNTAWATYTFYGDTFKVIYKRGGIAEQLANSGYNYGPEFEGVDNPTADPDSVDTGSNTHDHSGITDPEVLQEVLNFEEDIWFLSMMMSRGLTLGDADNVEIIRMHYNWLSDEAKAAISDEDMAILEEAERQIEMLREQANQISMPEIPPESDDPSDNPAVTRRYIIGKDTWSFRNTGTGKIPLSEWRRIMPDTMARICHKIYKNGFASCYGMSLLIPSIVDTNWPLKLNGNSIHDYSYSDVKEWINLGQIYQILPTSNLQDKTNKGNLSSLAKALKQEFYENGPAVVISIIDHEILPVAIIEDTSDVLVIEIYDPNYPDNNYSEDLTIYSTIRLYKNSKYYECKWGVSETLTGEFLQSTDITNSISYEISVEDFKDAYVTQHGGGHQFRIDSNYVLINAPADASINTTAEVSKINIKTGNDDNNNALYWADETDGNYGISEIKAGQEVTLASLNKSVSIMPSADTTVDVNISDETSCVVVSLNGNDAEETKLQYLEELSDGQLVETNATVTGKQNETITFGADEFAVEGVSGFTITSSLGALNNDGEVVGQTILTDEKTKLDQDEEYTVNIPITDDPGESIISIPEIKLSATDFTYKYKVQTVKVGKKKKKLAVAAVQKPAVTVSLNGKTLSSNDYNLTWSDEGSSAIGEYTVTATLKGQYSGSSEETYWINPKAVNLKKVAKGKKKFTASWKKLSKNDIKYKVISGYELRYSTDPDFTTDVKTVGAGGIKAAKKAISKLQPKTTYYVQLRTYKTVGGIKVYSDWSKAKKVTTK